MTARPVAEGWEELSPGQLLEAVEQVQAYLLPTYRVLCLQPKGWGRPGSEAYLPNGPEGASSTGPEKASSEVPATEE